MPPRSHCLAVVLSLMIAARAAAEPPAARTLTGHTAGVFVTYSPQGDLATYSTDRTIFLWDADGAVRFRLTGHTSPVLSAAFAPDGKTLAAADIDAVRLWDIASGQQRGALPLTEVAKLAYTADGKSLVCVNGHGRIRVWDVAAGKAVRTFGAAAGGDLPILVTALALSPDGKLAAVATSDGGRSHLRLWDVAAGKLVRTPVNAVPWTVEAAAFAPSGKTLAVGEGRGRVTLYDVAPWKKAGDWDAREQLRSLAFAPDGKTLALGLRSDVQLWNVAGGRRTETLTGHETWVQSLAFAPDGKALASGSADRTTRLWALGR